MESSPSSSARRAHAATSRTSPRAASPIPTRRPSSAMSSPYSTTAPVAMDPARGGHNRERGAAGASRSNPPDVRPGGRPIRRSQPPVQRGPRPRLAPTGRPARGAPARRDGARPLHRHRQARPRAPSVRGSIRPGHRDRLLTGDARAGSRARAAGRISAGRRHPAQRSPPPRGMLMRAYRFYLSRVMPVVVGLRSGDEASAYRYLADTVQAFPQPAELARQLEALGFTVSVERMTFGIVALHVAVRRR